MAGSRLVEAEGSLLVDEIGVIAVFENPESVLVDESAGSGAVESVDFAEVALVEIAGSIRVDEAAGSVIGGAGLVSVDKIAELTVVDEAPGFMLIDDAVGSMMPGETAGFVVIEGSRAVEAAEPAMTVESRAIELLGPVGSEGSGLMVSAGGVVLGRFVWPRLDDSEKLRGKVFEDDVT